jgi:hypothetical protein
MQIGKNFDPPTVRRLAVRRHQNRGRIIPVRMRKLVALESERNLLQFFLGPKDGHGGFRRLGGRPELRRSELRRCDLWRADRGAAGGGHVPLWIDLLPFARSGLLGNAAEIDLRILPGIATGCEERRETAGEGRNALLCSRSALLPLLTPEEAETGERASHCSPQVRIQNADSNRRQRRKRRRAEFPLLSQLPHVMLRSARRVVSSTGSRGQKSPRQSRARTAAF